GVPWRAGGLALFAPAIAWPTPAPAFGEAWVTTLDVGQGLAVVVHTQRHALLYDAGPAYGPEADSGGRVILPFLRRAGVAQLDIVMLTHADRDHVGGALSVLQSVSTARILSSLDASHPALVLGASRIPCARGQRWTWDGVDFEVRHPLPQDLRRAGANNRSCVLRVVSGAHAALLTGDIERGAEAELVAAAGQGRGLRADALIVPHHGSRPSSSAGFIAAVAPRWAIVPVGYRNRFGHPHRSVLARYRSAGAVALRSDELGAIEVRLAPAAASVRTARHDARRYWHAAPPR
ncbi:MAG: ComEC/Rec2 family competence protein, partial [bacterium]